MTDQRINLTYPPELPVSARKEEIARTIAEHQVVILAGETGSGKTTQIPKICLELGRGVKGLIGHTQPRRIAARAVAERIATELETKLGETVGYQVRFTDQVSAQTRLKLMTDGILLAEIQGDPLLKRYDTIIIDEAHERSLNIDFLLGYLARLLPLRPDLKVIITSATIDSQRFANHFSDANSRPAPIIEVSGRTYPVEIRYRPLVPDFDSPAETTSSSSRSQGRKRGGISVEAEADLMQGITDACDELMELGSGDILVFLAGERDIRDADQALREHLGNRYLNPDQPLPKGARPDSVEVLPLYARLSASAQQRVFAPHQFRRIVLATNVAETSLTVPGIRYVVDPGLARISRFSPKTKVQRLPIEPVSQASAKQRSGRCGRVAEGVAIRLYSEDDFNSRPEFTEPEILRTSLASVILQMSSLGLGKVEDFPFVDNPDGRAVRSGVNQLLEIGAVKESARGLSLTKIGRTLVRLPIDPRLGRMLLEGQKLGCATEVGVIVAALSIQDIRERPAESSGTADELHARFIDPTSDFITYLNLWRYVRTLGRDLSGSAFRRTVRAEFLHYLRIREWQDIYSQLRKLAKPLGISLGSLDLPSGSQISQCAAEGGLDNSVARACVALTASASTTDSDEIHKALLVGLLSSLGTWSEMSKDYEGARGVHFTIWPGSGLHKSRSDWVMAAELVETSRLFARTVARVKVSWIEPAAKHLLRRVYSEPFWSRRHGAAMVKEKVLLYGMTLIADRVVPLTRLGASYRLGDVTAAELAREMFIRHALVEGDWRTFHKFSKRNEAALAEAREFEERTRTPGLLVSEEERFTFFEERVPVEVTSGAAFDNWWKSQRIKDPHLLDFTREFLLPQGTEDAGFPDVWPQGNFRLPISYQFRPGRAADGITIRVPLEVLAQVRAAGFEWLVPGLLEELIAQTIRGFSKPLRRQLVPAPQFAARLRPLLEPFSPFAEGDCADFSSVGNEADTAGTPAVAPEVSSSFAQDTPEVVEPDPLAASLARLQGLANVRVSKKGRVSQKSLSADRGDAADCSVAKGAVVPSSARKSNEVKVSFPAQLSFRQAFARAVNQLAQVEVPADDWELSRSKLPDYLLPRFQVVASDGRVLATGPDLTVLQKQLASQGAQAVRSAVQGAVATALVEAQQRAGKSLNVPISSDAPQKTASSSASASSVGEKVSGKREMSGFDFAGASLVNLSQWPVLGSADDVLPDSVQSQAASGFEVRGFPGLSLVDASGAPLAEDSSAGSYPTVSLLVSPSAALRDARQERAVTALVLHRVRLSDSRITSRWNTSQTLSLAASSYSSTFDLVADLQWCAASDCARRLAPMAIGRPASLGALRSRSEFDQLVDLVRPQFEDAVYAAARSAAAALREYGLLDKKIRSLRALSLAGVASEVRAHAAALVRPSFVQLTGLTHLSHLSRYLQADSLRLDGALSDLARDNRFAWELSVAEDELSAVRELVNTLPEDARWLQARVLLQRLNWLLEEYRVSLFAQSLGTAQKVSLPRIRSLASEIRKLVEG
ncbi:ATP-dependent RNA helicase HrpA [Actinomycetaceae bacterium TAE3-ERU4]|nr:ATP-dependent RNA helicase HrpA [Actinomycetaceae bacterium TAE3-ERU4]